MQRKKNAFPHRHIDAIHETWVRPLGPAAMCCSCIPCIHTITCTLPHTYVHIFQFFSSHSWRAETKCTEHGHRSWKCCRCTILAHTHTHTHIDTHMDTHIDTHIHIYHVSWNQWRVERKCTQDGHGWLKCCTFTYTCIHTQTHIHAISWRAETKCTQDGHGWLKCCTFTYACIYTHKHTCTPSVEEQKENAQKMGMGGWSAVHLRMHAYTHTNTHTHHQLKSGNKMHTRWAWVAEVLYIYVYMHTHTHTHTHMHAYHQLKSGNKMHTRWAWVAEVLYIYVYMQGWVCITMAAREFCYLRNLSATPWTAQARLLWTACSELVGVWGQYARAHWSNSCHHFLATTTQNRLSREWPCTTHNTPDACP